MQVDPGLEVEKPLFGITRSAPKPVEIGCGLVGFGGDEVAIRIAQGKSAIGDPDHRCEKGFDEDGQVVDPAGPCSEGQGCHGNGVANGIGQRVPDTTGSLAGRQRREWDHPFTPAPGEFGTHLRQRIEMPSGNGGFARSGVGLKQTGLHLGRAIESATQQDQKKIAPDHLRKRPVRCRYSAIWMALVAAPFRRLSDTTHM